MTNDRPNVMADTEDFEFAALAEARNYRQALFAEFAAFLKGSVIEIGAGIGQMTEHLVRLPGVTHTLAIEPDPGFCARHRAQFPQHELLEGTAADLSPDTSCDAILSINVLEHIPDDQAELKLYAALRSARGSLVRLCSSPTGNLCTDRQGFRPFPPLHQERASPEIAKRWLYHRFAASFQFDRLFRLVAKFLRAQETHL